VHCAVRGAAGRGGAVLWGGRRQRLRQRGGAPAQGAAGAHQRVGVRRGGAVPRYAQRAGQHRVHVRAQGAGPSTFALSMPLFL
jgi:hypothetical protein